MRFYEFLKNRQKPSLFQGFLLKSPLNHLIMIPRFMDCSRVAIPLQLGTDEDILSRMSRFRLKINLNPHTVPYFYLREVGEGVSG